MDLKAPVTNVLPPSWRERRLFGVLTVLVVRVFDCRRAAKIGANNLQVSIACNLDKQHTRTIEDAGAAAVFNETLIFNLDCQSSDLIHIKVKHDSHFVDAIVGIFSLTLAEFIGETQGKRLKLQVVHPETFKPAGMIELMVEYQGTNDPMPDSHIHSQNASGATSPQPPASQPASKPTSGSNSPSVPPRPGAINVLAMQLAQQQGALQQLAALRQYQQAQQQQAQQAQQSQSQQPLPQPQQPVWTPPVNASGPVISGPVMTGAGPVYGSSVSYSNRPGVQMTVSAPVWTVANAATTFRYGPHGSPHWSPVGGQKSFFPQNGPGAPFVASQPGQQYMQINVQQYGSQQQQQQRPWQSPYASQQQSPYPSQPPAASYAPSASSPSAQPPPSAVRAPSIPIFSPTPLPPASAPSDAGAQPLLLSSVRKYEPPPMLSKPVLPSPSGAASVVAASAAAAASYSSSPAAAASVSAAASSPPASSPPLFSPMGGADGREWQPHATPRAGAAGPDSRPFDQLLQLKKRGDARVAQLRIWADECVHGLQFFFESPEEGASLIEGELAGVQLSSTGRPEVIRLEAGNAITAVGGRFNPNGVLEVLLIGTRRGAQRSFGGLGQAHPAGREFVLRIPAGHRVCGWHGSQNEEGFTSLGAYTGMARKLNSQGKLELPD